MKTHEFAEIFPMMSGKEFKELKEDIKQYGQQEPIILFEGKILDGRNRYNACEELGIKPKLKEYDGKDALQYVMSTNLKRRHLTDSQKAIVGRRYKVYYAKRYPQGQHQVELVPPEKARDRAGEVVGVSGRYIDMAEEVIEQKPELEEKIMSGEITVKQAAREIKIEEQKKEIEQLNLEQPKGEYDVIVIDPPWKVDFKYDAEHYMGRVANPYPEMDIQQIKDIKLPSKDNCILWLWTTHSQIWSAKEIMDEWGFEYKCILVWNKESIGIGKWLRKQCEFCLLATKGKPLWTATDFRDIISEQKTNHSAKPEGFYKLVEKYCVGRKLDYFARKKREGWDVFGDEIK